MLWRIYSQASEAENQVTGRRHRWRPDVVVSWLVRAGREAVDCGARYSTRVS